MVWIFQDGHLSGLLDFTPLPLDTSMLVLLFCIAFGLSMDYEVIVLSRIKELHDQGRDNRTAVTDGLTRSGRIVTTAAALIAVSFFAFGTATVSFLQLFGLGAGSPSSSTRRSYAPCWCPPASGCSAGPPGTRPRRCAGYRPASGWPKPTTDPIPAPAGTSHEADLTSDMHPASTFLMPPPWRW